MAYVDGFVIPIAKKNLPAYRAMARKAGKIWMELGAVDYHECVGDDLGDGSDMNKTVPFTKLAKTKPGETVVFSWITYKNKAHRDRVNKLIMKDPRITKMMEGKTPPFDFKRMAYGGFKTIVDM